MGPRAAVFCHKGIGDGVVSLVLSNNLHLNGWHVDTYQSAIHSMQRWFPHLPVFAYPPLQDVERILHQYEWFFVFHDDDSAFVQRLVAEGKRRFPDQMKVIYVYPSHRIVYAPYYQDSQIDPDLPLAENLRIFCEKILHLPKSTRSNGFIPPAGLTHRVHHQRVVIHPTSSREGRNWPKEKFVQLADALAREGYEIVWAVGPQERDTWNASMKNSFQTPVFESLDRLACFIYESGYLIGNDSGLGHLASFLEVPTVTICRRKTYAKLWAPSYASGIVVAPYSWIPNIGGFRLRDRHWKQFISVPRAQRAFKRLVRTTAF